MQFSSRDRVRIRVGIRYSVLLVNCYVHVFVPPGCNCHIAGEMYNQNTRVKYVCITTTNQPNTKYNIRILTRSFTLIVSTKQHAIINIKPIIVVCATRLETFLQGNCIAPFLLLSVVIVLFPSLNRKCINTHMNRQHGITLSIL